MAQESQAPYITGLDGLYELRIFFNDIPTVLDISSIQELTISSSLISFLPSIRFTIKSEGGFITHNLPVAKARTITIEFNVPTIDSQGVKTIVFNRYTFDIYRRMPVQDSVFDCEGLLSLPNAFYPRKCRGWFDTIPNVVTNVAKDMGFGRAINIKDMNISSRFGASPKKKNIVQPYINNVGLLNWLCQNSKDQSGGGLFFTFVDNYSGVPTFNFKSITELTYVNAKFNFMLGNGSPELSRIPVWEYKIEDNYKLIGMYGFSSKDYVYFDYNTSKLTSKAVNLKNFDSMTNSFFFTESDTKTSYNDVIVGRNNEYTEDYTEKATHDLYSNAINLSRLMISTIGLVNIHPGDTVDLIFGNANLQDNLNRQYNGKWMVEKIEHIFGKIYSNRLTLTRSGVQDYGNGLVDKQSIQRL